MHQTLLWLYLANATVLIAHEIDSARWKEWDLFWGVLASQRGPLPEWTGASGFVLLHLPLVALVLWGLVGVVQGATAGLVMSGLLGTCGVVAFTVHTVLIRRGHPEFRTVVSRSLLWGTLVLSIAQLTAVGAAVVG
jgi:hypothetical protein